jgi:alanyl-tRNA synthetase
MITSFYLETKLSKEKILEAYLNEVNWGALQGIRIKGEELSKVEELVNAEVQKANKVAAEVMPMAKAQEKGAMALFGEKYGNEVRVLTMGDFSVELCGATHVTNTGSLTDLYTKIDEFMK